MLAFHFSLAHPIVSTQKTIIFKLPFFVLVQDNEATVTRMTFCNIMVSKMSVGTKIQRLRTAHFSRPSNSSRYSVTEFKKSYFFTRIHYYVDKLIKVSSVSKNISSLRRYKCNVYKNKL